MNLHNQQKIIKNKLGLLNLAHELGSVSRACKVFGYSRDSFYRFKKLYEEHGDEGLQEVSRKKPNLKNRIAKEVEDAVTLFAIEFPAYGQLRVSNELKKKGIFISPGGVRNIWIRHNLHTMKLRLKSLEEKSARENFILTEAQVQALENAKEEKIAHGEIESIFPGYLGSRDTYFVGTVKGIGKIYQQTYIDTYAKVAFCKLYDRKNALVAADLLNDRVLPFYDSNDVKLLRMLTDRGSEYKGTREHHEYELYLTIEEIDHTFTKAKSPQTNGICERFHKTIQQEFYAVAFRTKIYNTLEELQDDLDKWIQHYNFERTHQGKNCEGMTPMECFEKTKHLAKIKMIGYNPKESQEMVS